jgi:transcription initiation factor TFIID subunit 15
MKCFGLSLVFLVVPQLSSALFLPDSHALLARQNTKFGGNRGNNRLGGNNNKNGGNNNTTNGNNNQNNGNNNNTNGNQNNGNNNGNPQTSLTLDPSVIQTINGTSSESGEADSLVSTNNFINFCVGKTITNGLQVQAGSCNPTPMGDIPSVDNMPSCKFQFPTNNGNVDPNTQFTVVLNTQGMQTGAFTDADTTYFGAPQQLNNGGQIIGHNHVVIEQIQSLDSTQPTNPRVFAFFKGLNNVAVNGQLTADVTNGLPSGTYRISTITTAANHQGVLVPVAQRGSVDDAVYFTVGGNGNNNNNGGNNNTTTTDNGGNNNNNTTTTNGGNNNNNTTTTANGNNKNGNGQNPNNGNNNQNPAEIDTDDLGHGVNPLFIGRSGRPERRP